MYAIYYTLDGSDPVAGPPSLTYGGAFILTATMTVKAMAVESGLVDSPVISAVYTVVPADGGSGAYQQDGGVDGVVSVEAENAHVNTAQGTGKFGDVFGRGGAAGATE